MVQVEATREALPELLEALHIAVQVANITELSRQVDEMQLLRGMALPYKEASCGKRCTVAVQIENTTELLKELQLLRVTRDVQGTISRGGDAPVHPASAEVAALEAKMKHNERWVRFNASTFSAECPMHAPAQLRSPPWKPGWSATRGWWQGRAAFKRGSSRSP